MKSYRDFKESAFSDRIMARSKFKEVKETMSKIENTMQSMDKKLQQFLNYPILKKTIGFDKILKKIDKMQTNAIKIGNESNKIAKDIEKNL